MRKIVVSPPAGKSFAPTTRAEQDEECICVAMQVCSGLSHAIAEVMYAVGSHTDVDVPGRRLAVRANLVDLYYGLLNEIDGELDGDDLKWNALLERALDRKRNPENWAKDMKRTAEGNGRLSTGALAIELDEEEAG